MEPFDPHRGRTAYLQLLDCLPQILSALFGNWKRERADTPIAGFLHKSHCFSVILNNNNNNDKKKKSVPTTLDLVSGDSLTARAWVRALGRIVNATKSIEIQKEYEMYLRDQFRAADVNDSGSLTMNEFSLLLRQLNIDLTEVHLGVRLAFRGRRPGPGRRRWHVESLVDALLGSRREGSRDRQGDQA